MADQSELTLKAAVEQTGGVTHLKLSGAITEYANLSALIADVQSSVVVDLADVDRINSLGIREWLHFIEELCKGRTVAIQRCSSVMVQQLGMISGATGDAEIQSIELPYYCAKCDTVTRVYRELREENCSIPDTHPCPKCKTAMLFDDLPQFYATVAAPMRKHQRL